VIEDAQAKRRTVIFPTLSNVVRLAQFGSVAEAFEVIGRTPVEPILPWMEKRDDGRYVCIPKDAGYTLTESRAAMDRA
jgi:hypothetical protein